ncbi:MAG: response regulator [Pseudomonadota bacterium]
MDDDASMRRFAALALDELPIRLQCVGNVAQALAVLREGPPPALLITDMMMPGQSGLDLLQLLADEPRLCQGTRVVALSAGLDASTMQQLDALGVWRQLRKPVSVAELEACVQDALVLDRAQAAQVHPEISDEPTVSEGERASVAQHFGGDLALFLAYRETCLLQFAQDMADGDQALASADAAALRRVAHNLKSVLATIGRSDGALCARQLEDAAAAHDLEAAAGHWARLKPHIRSQNDL